MTMTPTRAKSLDNILAGLALYENRRDDVLTLLLEATPPEEAVRGLLSSMDVMCETFAAHLGIDAADLIASVRRRIVREISQQRVDSLAAEPDGA